uniref:Uncharacterized protein n=1 Tax=Cacopsylla melanoneura TaxID=428564 RepID=A0A8D8VCV3_9HEMI
MSSVYVNLNFLGNKKKLSISRSLFNYFFYYFDSIPPHITMVLFSGFLKILFMISLTNYEFLRTQYISNWKLVKSLTLHRLFEVKPKDTLIPYIHTVQNHT